jgi:NhaA family Na+:H+ antiporter
MGIPPRTYGALQVKLRESLVTRAVVLPIQRFIHIQGISSIFLLGAAIAALVWANSPWHESYHHVWEMNLTLSRLELPVHAWINDALMAIFFFLVGMEIKHEIVHGELADFRQAALPIVAALGGMIAPALVYVAFNHGTPTAHGWGIPMATDIAFSLGVLGIVKGVPAELKVFLLSLAIADDIGAIAVIALFYTDELHLRSLVIGILLLIIIGLLLKLGVSQPVLYFVLGLAVWIAVLHSGIHATIAGVILGFMVPSNPKLSLKDFDEISTEMVERYRAARAEGDGQRAKNVLGSLEQLLESTESASERLTRLLNDWVSFLVLPLFREEPGRSFSGAASPGAFCSGCSWVSHWES